MKSKIEKLQLELEKLRKERFNARKIKEYHAREMKHAVEEDKLKDYEKHAVKHRFYSQKLETIRAELRKVEEEIRLEKGRIQQLADQKLLKTFDKTMTDKLTALSEALRLLVEKLELTDINQLANNVYDYFVSNSKGLKREDLTSYHMLGLLSVKVRCGHITEEFGDMQRIASTRGPSIAAQKVSNIKIWSGQLASQIEDCLKTVKERSNLWSNKEKLKRALNR